MIASYRTVAAPGSDEIVIRKSRFIGYALPVTTEAEATAFIDNIKKKHWDATHNCSAFLIGEHDEIQRSSDDGEPSGTAGKPILEVLRKQQLKNTAVVVTRYFGGMMLGAGGLVRAYTQGAVIATRAAGIVERMLHADVAVEVDYGWVGKIQNELEQKGYRLAGVTFLETVTFNALVPVAGADAFIAWMTNVTNGQARISVRGRRYVDTPVAEAGNGVE